MSVKKFTLGDLCFIEKGATGILKAIPGEYPLVVTGGERKSHNEFQFDDEAVIIPLVSGTGHGHASIKRIHYQTGKFALGSILCAVIPKDKSKLNAEYLYHFLDLNRENELVARMRGMANVTLPMKEIAKIEIPLPNLDDQKAFVKMYKSLGDKSQNLSSELTHQLDLVKKLRQQLLQDAIQGKLVAQNIKDEPASILLQKIKAEKEQLIKDKKLKKEKDLPEIKEEETPFEIPDNWVWSRLGEICNYGSSEKAEPKQLTKEIWVLDLEDIEKDSSKLLCKVRFSNRASLSTKSVFKKNQVLYSKLRPYLDKVIVADEDGVCTTEILPLDHYEKLNPYYLMYALKSKQFLKYVNSATKGMKMPRLGTSEGRNALIPVSPIEEQYRIVEKLEQLMQNCDDLEASIKQSQLKNEQLLQQILKEALTTEATVEAKEDEKHKSLLLAAEIIWQLNQKPTLGHIKLQKLVYLSNRSLQMNLPVNFLKRAMGPYDQELQEYIDKELAARQWFNYDEDAPLKYRPLQNAGGHKANFDKYFGEHAAGINHLIHLFEDARSSTLEIVATLYWCWDEMLTGRQLVNDTALLAKFYAFSDKKKKHTKDNVIKVLRWMEVQGIVPN